jgi:uncharacterized protein
LVAVDLYIVLMFLVALLAGLVGSMVGVGGGVLVVPALTVGFGIPIQYAVGASIISTIATSSGSASAYVRDRITNLRIGMFLEIGSVSGSIAGVLGVLYFVRSGLSSILYVLFGLVLFASAYTVVYNIRSERKGGSPVERAPNPPSQGKLRLGGEYDDKSLHARIAYSATRVPAGLAVMFCAGLMSGLLGVGGGALKVLGMDTVMRLPFKVSTTTSNFMIGVTATASTGILFINGYINVILAAPVAVGVVVGSLAGTKVLLRSKPLSVRILFILVLLAFGAEMVWMGVFH